MKEMLKKLKGRLSLHMPGHKGQLNVSDTTELPLTDDLYAPFSGILRAEAAMAKSCRAAAGVFLVGGSTAGVQSMLLTYLRPGDTVILPRSAHVSAINACALGDFNAVFVRDGNYLNVMAENPRAKAILVTRPDYYGDMASLERIAAVAQDMDMKLLVDEAHGAHLNWMPNVKTAMDCGADACVQSFHKTLPALNSAAVMLFKRKEDAAIARMRSRLTQTSSPSFPVLLSMDEARAFMDACGEERLKELIRWIDGFCLKAGKLGYKDLRREDRTRLVLKAPQGGQRLAAELMQKGIDVEMADDGCIVCILTVADDAGVLDSLYEALAAIEIQPIKPLPPKQLPLPMRKCAIREACFAPFEAIPLQKAVGRVAAVSFGLYPPGIPLAVPGEIITEEMLALLGDSNTFGVENGAVKCMVEEDI